MSPILKFALPVICLFASNWSAQAQVVKNNKIKSTPVAKFKPPKVKTTWGGHSDSAAISVKDALNLVNLPIKIVDDKKNEYSLSSYQFVWKRRVVTENEETGKVTPVGSMHTDLLRSTPLPEIWITSISQQLKVGEELLLLDVVVKDAQGRFFFAPTLKIKIR